MRPQPWETVDPWTIGKNVLFYGLCATAMYLFIGFLSFKMITNPTIYSPLVSEKNVEDVTQYYLLSFFYALSAIIVSLSFSYKKIEMEDHHTINLLFMVALFSGIFGGFALPVMRELALFLPPFCSVMIVTRLLRPDNPYITPLAAVKYLSIFAMAIFEVSLSANKATGGLVMYGAMGTLGMVTLGLTVAAREHHLKNSPEEPPETARPQLPYDIEGVPEVDEHDRAPQPKKPHRHVDPRLIFVISAAVLLAVFMPPLQTLNSEPDLDIFWQQRTGDRGHFNVSTHSQIIVKVRVINRGGQAAFGNITLTVRNDTQEWVVERTNQIEGFGTWYFEHSMAFSDNQLARRNLTVNLYYNSELVDTQPLSIPAFHPVFLAILLVVLKLWHDARKRPG